ncbi:MAG: hypothetical protein AAF566_08245 [Pseudomonadota bacterium]
MSSDFDIKDIDQRAIELEARRLRARAIASGVRSIRKWTMGVFHRQAPTRTT